MTENKKKRLAGLDLFRILMVCMVLLFHTQLHHGCNFYFAENFIKMGAIFMTGFFMLSGFVLFATYQERNLFEIQGLKHFYLKRIIAIAPLYLIVSLVYMFFCSKETLSQNLLLIPIEILGLQSFYSSLFHVSHNDGTWFISCLFFCYLLFPFMQGIVKQISPKGRLFTICSCYFILLLAPVIIHAFSTADIYSNPFFRGLEFFIGVNLYALNMDFKKNRRSASKGLRLFALEFFILGSIISLAIHFHISPTNYMLYSIGALPLFAFMLTTLSSIESPKMESSKTLRYFSTLCYAFFLAQVFNTQIENFIFTQLNVQGNGLKIAIPFMVCGILAVAMHELIERPCSKFLKKKWLGNPYGNQEN